MCVMLCGQRVCAIPFLCEFWVCVCVSEFVSVWASLCLCELVCVCERVCVCEQVSVCVSKFLSVSEFVFVWASIFVCEIHQKALVAYEFNCCVLAPGTREYDNYNTAETLSTDLNEFVKAKDLMIDADGQHSDTINFVQTECGKPVCDNVVEAQAVGNIGLSGIETRQNAARMGR